MIQTKTSVECVCPLCSALFKWGPERFDGREIKRYDLKVCNICWQQSWGGWKHSHEEKIIAHLEKSGLPIPERNARGLLPRE